MPVQYRRGVRFPMKTPVSTIAAPTTIVDVAHSAGVSIKTVSRVINREPRVTALTRQKVMKAIEDLGYQRNMFARGLRADKSLVLGLLYENPQGDYPSDVLYGALSHCRDSGYHLQVEVLRGRDMAAQTARFLTETRLDGALLTPPVCDNAPVLEALEKRIGFRFLPGLSERVIFRELFLSGLTLMDLDRAGPKGASAGLSMAQAAARQEVRALLLGLNLLTAD